MENSNEFLQDLIKEGIKKIKDNKETSEAKETKDDTKEKLLDLKKDFVKKYVEKNINNPILQATWIAEDYLISEGFWDKIKDKFIYERLLEKWDIENKIFEEMKWLKRNLEKIKTESELSLLENRILKKNITPQKKVEDKNEEKTDNGSKTEIITENKTNNELLKQNIETELNKYVWCPLTAEMIIISAQKHKVPVEYIMAIMRNDSHYGTKWLGAKTHNPGNVGNTDDGSTKNWWTRENGVDAVAKNLARRIKEYQNIYGNSMPSIKELANNQWPDKKWFLSSQWNYKKKNKERLGAYMTAKNWWDNVENISNQLAQNIYKEERLVA